MFTWLENFIQNASGDVKSIITIVLWFCAIAFIIKPAISSMKAFGDKKWGEGLSYLAGCVVIVIVAVIATVGLLNAGKQTGDDFNNQAQFIQAIPVLMSLYLFNKKEAN